MSETRRLKKVLTGRKKKRRNPNLHISQLLSTGSTLVNCAITGNPLGGFIKGKMHMCVGDSGSGKTFFHIGGLAEASIDPKFDNYRLIYDNVEDGALMEFRHYFGNALAERLEPPARDPDGQPMMSETIEDFQDNVYQAGLEAEEEGGRPFIYVLDSMDGLTSVQEEDKFLEQHNARRKGKKAAGSYGDGKAKSNSSGLRTMIQLLRRTESILIIICQTRDSLGFGFNPKTYSGGRALKFYATTMMWTAAGKAIKKKVRGTDRKVGVNCIVKFEKNRATGQNHVVGFPIYFSYGVDDIGSCIDFLIKEKEFKQSGNSITAEAFKFKGTREKFISYLEEDDVRVLRLRRLVGKVWNEVQAQLVTPRKPKYQ